MSQSVPARPHARRARRSALVLAVSFAVAAFGAGAATAADPVGLGTADSFAVLAGAGITNTGPTTINGDVGTFPTTTRSGFGSVTLTGTDHGGDAVTQGAKDDLVTAYNDAAGRGPATPHAVELGGETLLAGVYTSETFGLTGTLTLDAQGVAGAQFVFQAGTTLITEVDSRVLLINGASPCNVVWQVGSSATFKTGTRFSGDVLAYMSITAQTSATFVGRLLARDGAVTLDTNTISNAGCRTGSGTTPTPSGTPAATASVTPSGTVPTSPAASAVGTTRAPRPAVTAAGPAGGPATGIVVRPLAPRVPGTTGGGAAAPSLPSTGIHRGLAVSGLLLLVSGSLVLASGGRPRRPGRHRLATR